MSSGGHPPFVPRDDQRRPVEILRGAGNPVALIAHVLDIDEKTLRRHFRPELEAGKEALVAALGVAVIKAGLNGDWRAALSWLARHAPDKWRLRDEPEPRQSAAGAVISFTGGLPEWPREPAS